VSLAHALEYLYISFMSSEHRLSMTFDRGVSRLTCRVSYIYEPL
jgi:hypothetical protein